MASPEAPRLLARERHDLDAVAESLRDGRRVVAFLVCSVGLRATVTGYLSEQAGRVVQAPKPVSDPENMLALLSEAADGEAREVCSLALDATQEDTVRALNWHREKLRRGASVLVWMEDVEGLRVVRRLAPDAYSFRDTLVAVEGEKSFPVVLPDLGHQEIRLARLQFEAARTPIKKADAARNLAAHILARAGSETEGASNAIDDALQALSAPGIDAEEAAAARARLSGTAAILLLREGRRVNARRDVERALAGLARFQGTRAHEARLRLIASFDSPLGSAPRALLGAVDEARTMDVQRWVLALLLSAAASSAEERGDLRRASALLREIVALPNAHELYRAKTMGGLGRIALRAGRLADAERAIRDAAPTKTSLGAGNGEDIRPLARCLSLRGDSTIARAMLTELLRSNGAATISENSHARRDLHQLDVEIGAVSEGLEGLRTLLEEASASHRDGIMYEVAATFTDCLVDAHDAGRLSLPDLTRADSDLLRAQEVAVSISGDDPPWYHILYPTLRGRLFALLPERRNEAIEMTRAALSLAERTWSDAVPLLSRTLSTHLFNTGSFQEALSVIEHATPQLVAERFLEDLSRIQAIKIASLVQLGAPAADIDLALQALRATFEEMDAPRITAETLLELSLFLPARSTHPDPVSLLEEARELFADMPIVAKEARCSEAIGDILAARGDAAGARGHHHTALELLRRHDLGLRVPLLEKKLGSP